MTHGLSKTVLYFSSAVSCLCLTLVLQVPDRQRKGHLSPQKCLTATFSLTEEMQPPFPPQCACELGNADTEVSKYLLTAYGYFKSALCAANISKVMFG